MPWPLSQDYNEAVQNPETSFADPELRGGAVTTNALGLPMPCSGNFADVYRFNCPASRRSWAVKCFTRQIPGLQERYQQISRHLAQGKPSFMVDFTFLERGIQVRAEWYPILKMQWVEGLTLNQFVKSNLDKPQVLDGLCQLWVKLSARLREANIAHCDLQHGNVLLVPGGKAGSLHVRLVDYDGMYVPALTLLKSIEGGHPSYQHPQRLREGVYGLEVDRFSHLVIYTALRALAVGGKALWDKYDDGDNLLFKPSDYAAPPQSALLNELRRSMNAEVRQLANAVVQALSRPLEQVPLLEQCAAMVPPTATGIGSAPAQRGTHAAPGKAVNKFGAMTTGTSAARQSQGGKKRSLAMLFGAGLLGIGLLAGAGFLFLGDESEKLPTEQRLAHKEPELPIPRGKPLDHKPPLSETLRKPVESEPQSSPMPVALHNPSDTKKTPLDPQPTPQPPDKSSPPAMTPEPKPEQMVYVADLPIVGRSTVAFNKIEWFSTKGQMVFGGSPTFRTRVAFPMQLNGVHSPHGIYMHGRKKGFSSVTFALNRKYRSFHSRAAVPSSEGLPDQGDPATPLSFSVWGSKKLLWQSRPLRSKNDSQECEVDIQGVKGLELRVHCAGGSSWACAGWVEPVVKIK